MARWWQRPSVQLRPHDVPQPGREREKHKQQEKANGMRKAHDTLSEKTVCEVSFSYGKWFSYKSSFLNPPPPQAHLECSIFRRPQLLNISPLWIQRGSDGLTDDQKVESKAVRQIKLSPSWRSQQTLADWQSLLHSPYSHNDGNAVLLFFYFSKSTPSKDLLDSRKPLPKRCPTFHTRISSSSSSKKEEKLLSSSGGALKVALSVSPA